MKTRVMLLSIALLVSCANPSAKNHIKKIESQIIVTDSGEDFNSFYHHFVSDSIFQAIRVVFPINVVSTSIQETGIEMDNVEHFADNTGWDYIRLVDYLESDQDTQRLTFNNDSTEADLKMLVDQTTVSTSFIRENGKWYLHDYKSFDWRNGW